MATDGNAPVPSGPAWLAKPASTKLAGAGWLPAAVGRDQGQVQRQEVACSATASPATLTSKNQLTGRNA